MRFSAQFLDELKARLPVSEVVGKRVALKKAGREWKGLSPFNKEKTASFFVNDQKQAWFDFSSGKNGNIFDFVMETEGVSFPEAVERLAGMAGVVLPKYSKEEEVRDQKRKTLHEVMELAARFFEANLQSRVGAKARGYLADRRIEAATQLKFRMGYAPAERFAMKEHLGKEGVSAEDMIETGLLISGEDIPVPYDRFRDRVMFPITDFRGRIIAFGGRALDPQAPAKYLNSPETTLFHKGNNLYNGAAARQATHDGAPLIVVEGYVDVIAMVTAGYPATVAPLGTALTEEQLGLIWKMADEPILCFDGDKAGQRAAFRALDMALPRLKPGKSVQFALLPEGQDPDDLFRSGGRQAIAEVLAGARGLADMLWTRETQAGLLDTPERRAALEARLKDIIRGIADETVRRYYSDEFASRLRQFMAPKFMAPKFDAPGRAGSRYGGAPSGRRGGGRDWKGAAPRGRFGPPDMPTAPSPRLAASSIVRGHFSSVPPREALLLLTVINHPWLLEHHAEELADLDFVSPDADRLRRAVLDISAGQLVGEDPHDPQRLRATLADRKLGAELARLDGSITHRSDWPAQAGTAADDVAQWWAHVVTLHRKTRTLNRELKDAEHALGEDPTDANLAWLRDVQARLSALEGFEAQIEGFGASSGRAVGGS